MSYDDLITCLTLYADLFVRIAELACDLCKKLKKATLQAHEIQTAYVTSFSFPLLCLPHTCPLFLLYASTRIHLPHPPC
jgi:hypothetical protein